MYWYLSFLRPPPVSTSASSESITITPQVANDLRTEIRWEPTEVYYVWQRADQPNTTMKQRAQHLTTFIPPDSTYRPLSVPLPTKTRSGQRWRLGLFPDDSATASQRISDAAAASSSLQVIGVWSEPIEITAGAGPVEKRETKKTKLDTPKPQKGKGKEKDEGPKQTRIHRQWLLDDEEVDEDGGLDSGRLLSIIEQTSYDLDKKIWDSGLALSAWLYAQLPSRDPTASNPTHGHILDLLRKGSNAGALNVLELGSGTGLVSIALRSYLSTAKNRATETEINATDLESAMELMNENIELNEPVLPKSMTEASDTQGSETPAERTNISLSAKTLDWDNPLPAWVTLHHPDLIVAADVTYNTASFPSLVNTLSNLMLPLSPENKRPPLLLAYKQRDEAERELWDMLKQKGIDLALIDKIAGAEEEGAVEIWVGKAINM